MSSVRLVVNTVLRAATFSTPQCCTILGVREVAVQSDLQPGVDVGLDVGTDALATHVGVVLDTVGVEVTVGEEVRQVVGTTAYAHVELRGGS